MHEPFGERSDDAGGDRLELGAREKDGNRSSTQGWMVSASCRPVMLANTAMAAPMMPSRGTSNKPRPRFNNDAPTLSRKYNRDWPLMAITYWVSPRQPFTRCAPARMTERRHRPRSRGRRDRAPRRGERRA